MRRLGALPAALALTALLAGCGGGGGSPSSDSTSTAPSPTTAPASSQPSGQKRSPEPQSPPSSATPDPARQSAPQGAPTPGSKAVAAGVPVTKGADNSIQSFGTEGQEAQRSQALADLRSYLGALGAKEWSRACALASAQFRAQLAKLIAEAKAPKGAKKPRGCAGVLAALLGKAPSPALARLARVGELLSFRVEEPYAYLIYRGAQGKPMFIAMRDEEGKWKVNVPKPEAFTEASEGSGR